VWSCAENCLIDGVCEHTGFDGSSTANTNIKCHQHVFRALYTTAQAFLTSLQNFSTAFKILGTYIIFFPILKLMANDFKKRQD
jgi:hypothetical protein